MNTSRSFVATPPLGLPMSPTHIAKPPTGFLVQAARLSALQDHIFRQNRKTLAMIWRDKRNPHQWYTFWAVIYINGFSIVLSIIQTLLAGVQ